MEATRKYTVNQVRKAISTYCVVMVRCMVFNATENQVRNAIRTYCVFRVRYMVFNANLSYIVVVRFFGRVHGENNRPFGSPLHTLSHNVSSIPRKEQDSYSQF